MSRIFFDDKESSRITASNKLKILFFDDKASSSIPDKTKRFVHTLCRGEGEVPISWMNNQNEWKKVNALFLVF